MYNCAELIREYWLQLTSMNVQVILVKMAARALMTSTLTGVCAPRATQRHDVKVCIQCMNTFDPVNYLVLLRLQVTNGTGYQLAKITSWLFLVLQPMSMSATAPLVRMVVNVRMTSMVIHAPARGDTTVHFVRVSNIHAKLICSNH